MKQIDEISDTVDKLEAAAYKLDAYSIALENRVKSVLQRRTTMHWDINLCRTSFRLINKLYAK